MIARLLKDSFLLLEKSGCMLVNFIASGIKAVAFVGVMSISLMTTPLYAKGSANIQSLSFSGIDQLDKVLKDKSFKVADIQLQRLSFDHNAVSAEAILQSKRNDEAQAFLGLALLDGQGELLAIAQSEKAHIFAKTAIYPGKDKTLRFDFSAYLEHFDKVKTLKLVMRVADIEVVKSRKKF